jgi:uncharacterized protein YjiS (DUF1127 family)
MVGRTQGTTMSTTTVNAPSRIGRIAQAYTAIRRSFQARKVQRETYRTLSSLSDRELNDIGIYRGDIPGISRETGGMYL